MAGRSAAHEYWLAPSSYTAPANRPVTLTALAGTGFRGERKPFAASHCARLIVRAARTLDLGLVARSGDYTWASFTPADQGGALFAFESDFTPITLAAAEFDAYLAKEGLEAPLAARRASRSATPGRERFRRCAKAWLAGRESSRITRPAGLPLEIVPLGPPGEAPRLAVRVLWQGRAARRRPGPRLAGAARRRRRADGPRNARLGRRDVAGAHRFPRPGDGADRK